MKTEYPDAPTGFVARCRCGKFTGAISRIESSREELGKVIGIWLIEGKTIEPRWGTWCEDLNACSCDSANTKTCHGPEAKP